MFARALVGLFFLVLLTAIAGPIGFIVGMFMFFGFLAIEN